MMYKALISFTGLVSMAKGDVREISDISLANDLIKAGYIEEVKEAKPAEKPKAEPKKTTKNKKETVKKSPKKGESAK